MIHTPMIKASKYIKGMLLVKVNESIAGVYRSIEIIKTGFLPYRSPNLGKNIHPMKIRSKINHKTYRNNTSVSKYQIK